MAEQALLSILIELAVTGFVCFMLAAVVLVTLIRLVLDEVQYQQYVRESR